jgi:hypothetical protein
MESLGQNVEYELSDGKLHIVIDTVAEGTPSASGKTVVVATTRGNVKIAGGHLGINFYRYPDRQAK